MYTARVEDTHMMPCGPSSMQASAVMFTSYHSSSTERWLWAADDRSSHTDGQSVIPHPESNALLDEFIFRKSRIIVRTCDANIAQECRCRGHRQVSGGRQNVLGAAGNLQTRPFRACPNETVVRALSGFLVSKKIMGGKIPSTLSFAVTRYPFTSRVIHHRFILVIRSLHISARQELNRLHLNPPATSLPRCAEPSRDARHRSLEPCQPLPAVSSPTAP